MLVQALMFVTVMCIRDAITRTLQLMPVPVDGVFWSWVIALLHIALVMVAVSILTKYRLVPTGVLGYS